MFNLFHKRILLALGLGILISFSLFVLNKTQRNNNLKGNDRTTSSIKKNDRSLEPSEISEKITSLKSESKIILNDPALKEAWGIETSQALKAWEISQGSAQFKVAVIDTGCDLKHEDLHSNFWKNPEETGLDKNGNPKETNGIDDDENGFPDDVYGWNFVSNNNDLSDNHGHGTHISGIIGAISNNGKGIVGIAPKVQIICIKYYDPKISSDHLKNTISAIEYAIKVKADIINYSGGGLEPSEAEKAVIQKAKDLGILFVAAAGNERSNSDIHKYYPADYGLDNIISVTAINPDSQVLPSSNYGIETVDIAAPGHKIISTLPGSSYGTMTGTSQATAFVTGAAVLIKAHHPHFTYQEVKKHILVTGDTEQSLVNKTRTARRLNLFKALVMMDSTTSLTGIKGLAPQDTPLSGDSSSLPTESSLSNFSEFGKSLLNKLDGTKREGANTRP